MVKSRFPGKPGKYFHRKKASSAQTHQDYEGAKTAEDIYHRLSVFNALFGDEDDCSNGEDEVSSFHGFSPHETQTALKKHREKVKTFKRQLQERGAKEEFFKLPSSLTTHKIVTKDSVSTKDNKSVNKIPCDTKEYSSTKQLVKGSPENISPESSKGTGVIESSELSPNDSNSKVTVNAVSGIFVLPSRSAHSSRVIKPNKRFIQTDTNPSSPPKKARLLGKTENVSRDIIENCKRSELFSRKSVHRSVVMDYCLTRRTSDGSSTKKCRRKGDGMSSPAKVILRKPRLKIKSHSYAAVEGPFSSSSSSSTALGSERHSSLSAKVVCGVCGSVRLYKFLKQARKFGIFSCEPCRRFILRIVKLERQKNLIPLTCNTGNGTCRIRYSALDSSVTFSTELSQKKNDGDGPRRCQGCWLHLCLRSFKMPPDLQNRLSAYLPEFLANNPSGYNSIPGSKWGNVTGLATLSTSSLTCVAPGRSLSYEVARSIKKKATAIARRDATPVGLKLTGITTGVKIDKESKRGRSRQKLPAPGPRIKHVCRSASLVLGQPTATFVSSNKTNNETKKMKSEELVPFNKQNCRNTDNGDSSTVSSSRVLRGNSLEAPSPQEEIGKHKQEIAQLSSSEPPIARMLQDLGRVNWELLDGIEKEEAQHLHAKVSIDFWESYDPEEVAQSGFSLLGYGPFRVRAVCFLCGSAGHDKLIHCASCCEPYHTYCVSNLRNKTKDWWKVNWLCPRCTHCEACSKTGGAQVTCTKCHKSFHTACITTARFNMTDINWLCPSCLCCKSCSNKRVHVFIGNLPLCKTCYRLRKKGSFCPLCQRCYDDNDYSTKMMECAQCKSWIHAACEGLSNEKYQVLSFLPSSIEFICRLCCDKPPALWSLAVDAELRAGYLNVLKSLSKNRSACALLKTSPQKKNGCACRDSHRTPIHLPNLTESSVTEKGKSHLTTMNITSNIDDKNDFGLLTPKMTKDDEESLKTVKSDFLNLVNDKVSLSDKEKMRECSIVLKSISEHSVSTKSDDPQLLSVAYRIDRKPQLSPQAASQCDSGIGSVDEEQKSSVDECYETREDTKTCSCQTVNNVFKPSLNLMLIKNRVSSDEYSSLLQFHQDMEQVIDNVKGEDILKSYHKALRQAFPWFDPKGSQICESLKDTIDDTADTVVEERKTSVDTDESETKIDTDVSNDFFKGLLDLEPDYYYYDLKIKDSRNCMLCKLSGEGLPTKEERLLYCGNNEWVHANCALWSSEVFEEIDGSLQNVHSAISRARLIRCFGCNKKGASIGCCARSCPVAYHFNCALTDNCVFLANKEVYCKNHNHLTESKELHKETDFPISRSIYVELDHRKKKDVPRNEVRLFIGSLYVESFGNLVPEYSDEEDILIPCEFKCTRLYWSSVEPWRIVQYHIKTKIQTLSEHCCENDINYTVDHSLDFTPPPSPEETLMSNSNLNKRVCEKDIKTVIGQILDAVCSKEEENNFSDQQGTDLLPPEIKDAIFEDLPHDLLDGISMHDIFPKMNFDDISADPKNDKTEPYIDTDGNSEPINKKVKLDEDDFVPKSSINVKCKANSNSSSNFRSQQANCNSQLKTFCKLRSSTNIKEIGKQSDLQTIVEKNKESKWKKKNILQVDGAIDCSESEHSNDSCDLSIANVRKRMGHLGNQNGSSLHSVSTNTPTSFYNEPGSEDQPVKCPRCHRTYRTSISFNRHLPTCNSDFLSCSESDSSEEEKSIPPLKIILPNGLDTPTNSLTSANFNNISLQSNTNSNISLTCSVTQCHTESLNSRGNMTGRSNISKLQVNKSHSNVDGNILVIAVSENQNSIKQSQMTVNNISPISDGTFLGCSNSKPIITNHVQEQIIHSAPGQHQSVVEIQTPTSNGPAIILQPVHTDNLLPTFIDPYQQSSQPSIQYVAAIESQEKAQYLTSPLVPSAFHIQPGTPVVQNVPTLLGTIIQPGGVEQIVVNSGNPGVEVYGPQQNGVFITNTPVYVGMETVVSNTVMSSSQFFSSSIPGMLAASSYSATTTQVFQATKPILDIPQGYVVLNTNPSVIENTSQCVPQIITNASVPTQQPPWSNYQVNFQEAYKMDKNTAYQTVTRQIIREEKEIAGVKMINSTQETIVIEPLNTVKNVHTVTKHKKEIEGPVKELSKLVNQISSSNSCNKFEQPQNCQVKPNIIKLVELPKSSAVHKEKPQQAVAPVVVKKIVVNEQREPFLKKCELPEKIRPKETEIKIAVKKKKDSCDKVKVNGSKEVILRNPLHLVPRTISPPSNPIRNKDNTLLENNIVISPCSQGNIPKIESKTVIGPVSKNKDFTKPFRLHKDHLKPRTTIKDEPKITYEITSEDGFSYTTTNVLEAWQKVFESVQTAREGKGLPPLNQNPFSSPDSMLKKMMGLGCNSMKYVLEQLPGVGRCVKYKPLYHKKELSALDYELKRTIQNPSGCARTEPYNRTSHKYDMFSWLASRHRRPPKLITSDNDVLNGNGRRATSSNLPMAMRFRHLKETSKQAVGVFRSDIHGRGLFCLRDIESGEMVIEYAGELIRSALTDLRERYYTAKGIGCYMFRIDDRFVVDATMKGNAARFINHSCEPNCYSRVVDILGKKHILIFALRRIPQGEELTYDYKFPLEEDKINCHCLSRKCRKYLN